MPTLTYLLATRASFSLDLRGRGGVDGHGLAFTGAEQPVGIDVELAPRTRGRGFICEREMREDRADIPPFAPGRAFPRVTRTRVDQLGELGVLRGQRSQDVFHAPPR